jgi:hypothetical protein
LAVDLQIVSLNFGVEIRNKLTAAKIVCKERLTLNFISVAVKELLAEKRREGLSFSGTVTVCVSCLLSSRMAGMSCLLR